MVDVRNTVFDTLLLKNSTCDARFFNIFLRTKSTRTKSTRTKSMRTKSIRTKSMRGLAYYPSY